VGGGRTVHPLPPSPLPPAPVLLDLPVNRGGRGHRGRRHGGRREVVVVVVKEVGMLAAVADVDCQQAAEGILLV
jgi:hypothetical protein